MRKLYLFFTIPVSIILLSFSSCKRKQHWVHPCRKPYTINQLFKDYDSSRFKIEQHKDFIKVFDTVKFSQQGVYKFDNNNNLVSYRFIQDWGDTTYTFGIKYDLLGNVIDKKGSAVANWFVGHKGNDSFVVSFALYSLNNSYGHIILNGSDFSAWIPLEESIYYSNMYIGEHTISKHQEKNLTITGEIIDKCSNEKTVFTDSIALSELY